MTDFKSRIFYEIYPSSFADSNGDGMGDIQGIIGKLDYIQDLGFNGIWLNPIYESPFKDGGYDISDFFKISSRFGTLDDLKELIEEVHKRDIILFLDLVPGHVSTENPDFIESARPERNEKSDLFIWNDNVWNNEPGYRLMSGFYDRDGAYMVNFFGHQPAINYGFATVKHPWQKLYTDPSVPGKNYLIKIMKYYLALGVDGFRVDMADSLVKNEDDKECTIKLWKSVVKEVKKSYPHFLMTSEWSNPDRSLRAGFSSDFVLDHWDNFSHILFREVENGNTPLLKAFDKKQYKRFIGDLLSRIETAKRLKGELSIISGNHDTARIASYLAGEELKLAYLLLFTLPNVPYLFAGDEIGQKTNKKLHSKEGGYQRTGTRIPMVFNDEVNRGFSSADAEKLFLPIDTVTPSPVKASKDKNSLYNCVKELIALRKNNKDLIYGDFEYLKKPFAFRRGKITVYINLLDDIQEFPYKSGEIIFKIGTNNIEQGKIMLRPHAAVVIEAE